MNDIIETLETAARTGELLEVKTYSGSEFAGYGIVGVHYSAVDNQLFWVTLGVESDNSDVLDATLLVTDIKSADIIHF